MKVRIKFSKNGVLKFIGHLDTMRYFQKALRRAELPVAFSEGFNPHMIMSFAYPLGVGVTSDGEYFDLELTEDVPTAIIEKKLDAMMAEGMHIISARKIPEQKSSTGMALVAAADYLVSFRPGMEPGFDCKEMLPEFLAKKSVCILKKTKKSETMTDIRPWIYKMECRKDGIFMQLASGSAHNLKPELVMRAFYDEMKEPVKDFAWMIHRCEIYADLGTEGQHNFVSLEGLGEIVE